MIEIGEYVRTKEGYLGKLIAINKQDYNYLVIDTTKKIRNDEYPATYLYLRNEDIVKHFKDIKDLIGEEDILQYKINKLSGYKIGEVKKYKDARSFEEYLGVEGFGLEQIIILNVLTKEQFNQNCYEVEEN